MKLLYIICHCTWGGLQTLLGAVVLLTCRRAPHCMFHGCVVTHWQRPSGLSLGLFVFLPRDASPLLLAHEYGHTLQSLLLGPLYLLVIGLPSFLWFTLPAMERRRQASGRSYYSFYTERWADRWGKPYQSDSPPQQL